MPTTTTTRPVSLLIEVPEPLHKALQDYLDTHPGWDQDRVINAALSLFLMQNGKRDRAVSNIYLSTLFDLAA